MAQAPHQTVNLFLCKMKHVDVQIQTCPPDKFYDTFRNKGWLLGGDDISPDYIQSIVTKTGGWDTVGSEKEVTYYPEGISKTKTEKFRDRLEGANELAKSVTFQVLSGDIMGNYKSFFAELMVTNVGGCNWARWTVAYEKKAQSSPDPQNYLDLLEKISKDVDAHLPSN